MKAAIATLHTRAGNRRKDWVEKTSTDLAQRFDVIRVEDLRIAQMTRRPKPKPDPDPDRPGAYLPNGRRTKAGLNRGILANGWGALVRRLEGKAPGRVEKINPAYTSQTCNVCEHRASESRESGLPVRRLRTPGARGRECGIEHCGRAGRQRAPRDASTGLAEA